MNQKNLSIQTIDISKSALYANYPKMKNALHVSTTALYKFNLPKLLPSVDKGMYIGGDNL